MESPTFATNTVSSSETRRTVRVDPLREQLNRPLVPVSRIRSYKDSKESSRDFLISCYFFFLSSHLPFWYTGMFTLVI